MATSAGGADFHWLVWPGVQGCMSRKGRAYTPTPKRNQVELIWVSSITPIGMPIAVPSVSGQMSCQLQLRTQLGDAVTLREQPVAGNQSGGLNRCDDVQPYAGYDQAHRKSGKPADEAAKKCCKNKGRSKRFPSMLLAPQESEQRLHGVTHFTGRLRCPRSAS